MRITEIKTYIIAPSIERPRECKFMNRVGAWDSIQLTKYRTESIGTEPTWYHSATHQKVAEVSSEKEIQYFTQWYPGDCFEWLKDLVLSPEVYIDGKYVKIKDMSYEYDNKEYLFSFTLTVVPQWQENRIRR